jgi:hypothetical protein
MKYKTNQEILHKTITCLIFMIFIHKNIMIKIYHDIFNHLQLNSFFAKSFYLHLELESRTKLSV